MDVAGGVFIVTGSATGLGATVAQRLAGKGARVVINYTKSENEALATAQACRDLGAEAIVCRADVSVDDDCRRMVAEALAEWGRVDGLVNNAAQSKIVPHADLEGLSSEDFRNIFAVNVVGAYQMVRAVTPPMQRQGKGAIVNISSVSAITGSGSSIAYAASKAALNVMTLSLARALAPEIRVNASKAALNVMTLSLARALAPEIRVNAVCPGVMQTRWWREGLGEENYDAFISRYAASAPLKTAGTTEAVADPVVWLLEGAEHVTGETIMVDAGSHLGPSPAR